MELLNGFLEPLGWILDYPVPLLRIIGYPVGMERQFLSQTTDAARLLGLQLAAGRRRQRRTAQEIAERAGTTRVTLRRIERGDPNVAIGLYFEVASVLSVPLFGAERKELSELVARGERELALLPARIHAPAQEVSDDF